MWPRTPNGTIRQWPGRAPALVGAAGRVVPVCRASQPKLSAPPKLKKDPGRSFRRWIKLPVEEEQGAQQDTEDMMATGSTVPGQVGSHRRNDASGDASQRR